MIDFIELRDGLCGVPFLITTTRDPRAEQVREARSLAERTGQTYVERSVGSLTRLYEAARHAGPSGAKGILVVHRDEYTVWLPEGLTFRYHPGMAVHRIKSLAQGGHDPMISAMELGPGERVLDCTAGLCSDALVASFAVGPEGAVQAVESSLPVALTVAKGLRTYECERKDVTAPMRRIRLVAARSDEVLRELPDGAFDVVYFDPMFHEPVRESTGIAPLRYLADPSPVSAALLTEAARVARRSVVIKDRTDGPWAHDPRITRFVGGRKRRIGYAVISGAERSRLVEGA
ncbi:MAG: class I SAM-dependent methyltransferase [Firmicutes bacterium]|nr:class I SAM-dependent methyltransferase [Bacillota bacterium]